MHPFDAMIKETQKIVEIFYKAFYSVPGSSNHIRYLGKLLVTKVLITWKNVLIFFTIR
jgi:hypothetical protein